LNRGPGWPCRSAAHDRQQEKGPMEHRFVDSLPPLWNNQDRFHPEDEVTS
jgi:hypothetical protein